MPQALGLRIQSPYSRQELYSTNKEALIELAQQTEVASVSRQAEKEKVIQ